MCLIRLIRLTVAIAIMRISTLWYLGCTRIACIGVT
nr:MAG TPA: hypothetical protein [Bacteriophage sp.]